MNPFLGIANRSPAPAEQKRPLSPYESFPPCFLLCVSSAIKVSVLHSRVLSFIKILLKTLLFLEAEVQHGSVNNHYVCFCVVGDLLPTRMPHLAHRTLCSSVDKIMALPRVSFLGDRNPLPTISQALSPYGTWICAQLQFNFFGLLLKCERNKQIWKTELFQFQQSCTPRGE